MAHFALKIFAPASTLPSSGPAAGPPLPMLSFTLIVLLCLGRDRPGGGVPAEILGTPIWKLVATRSDHPEPEPELETEPETETEPVPGPVPVPVPVPALPPVPVPVPVPEPVPDTRSRSPAYCTPLALAAAPAHDPLQVPSTRGRSRSEKCRATCGGFSLSVSRPVTRPVSPAYPARLSEVARYERLRTQKRPAATVTWTLGTHDTRLVRDRSPLLHRPLRPLPSGC